MMSAPGFTADASTYRARVLYRAGRGTAGVGALVPAGNCGFYCHCDPGQCCEVTWGGANCACTTCSTHAVEPPAQFLMR